MESGIYKIENIINAKIYIGSSKNIKLRWKQHKCALNNNKHHNTHLNNAWNKYGSDSFKFKIIEYVELNKLLEREQYFIKYYKCNNHNNGYNKRLICESNLGWKASKETKKRMSESAKKRPPISEETRNKLRKVNIGNKKACRVVSDKERKINSQSKIGINRGEKNGKAITNKDEIIKMRNDYDNGMSISKIMIKYGKKYTFTYQIVKRLRWVWLDT